MKTRYKSIQLHCFADRVSILKDKENSASWWSNRKSNMAQPEWKQFISGHHGIESYTSFSKVKIEWQSGTYDHSTYRMLIDNHMELNIALKPHQIICSTIICNPVGTKSYSCRLWKIRQENSTFARDCLIDQEITKSTKKEPTHHKKFRMKTRYKSI